MPAELLQTDHERRACTRLRLAYAVVLEAEPNVTIYGTSQDVSLGGLLIVSQDDLAQLRPGAPAQLSLLLEDGERTAPYPCSINRIGDGNVGIALDRRAAARFGLRLTKGLFSR